MTPADARILLHAYVDGELDAASTIELEAVVKASSALRQELARLVALQNALQARASRFQSPHGMTDRLLASLAASQVQAPGEKMLPRWRALAIGASAVAAALLIWIFGSAVVGGNRTATPVDEVVSAHIRSLMVDHLTDVASADRHSVKPWLSSRLPFAPPVHDLSSQGFHLVGGRLDYLGGRAVAAIVYQHRQHIINVFVWPSAAGASSSVQETSERGYNTARFDAGPMSYRAVSDVNAHDLRKLVDLLLRS